MEKEIKLTLYVGGEAIGSKRIIQQLRGIMENNFKDKYVLDIVDVYDNMKAAEEDNILAIPTLIKEAPLPRLRLIGSFSDEEKVLHALYLDT